METGDENLFSIELYLKDIKLPVMLIEAYRMNITAISWKYKLFFVACRSKVSVFRMLSNGELDPSSMVAANEIVIEPNGESINQIKVAEFDGDEVLICVDNNAKYTIVKLSMHNFDKVILDNIQEGIADNTTWSLDAIEGKKDSWLACGSNSHNVTIWNTNFERRIIEAHTNNVPCIKFSPCGLFLASISIDKSIKIFHSETGKLVCHFPKLERWGWSICWIEKKDIYGYPKDFSENNDELASLEKPKLNIELNNYLLLATDESSIYLIDPSGDYKYSIDLDDPKYQPYQMIKIMRFYFAHLTPSILFQQGRYALTYFMKNFSYIIIAAQHTPFINLIHMFYDKASKRFLFDPTDIKIEGNHILGVYPIEIDSEIYYLKRCLIYVVTYQKKLNVIELKWNHKTKLQYADLQKCQIYHQQKIYFEDFFFQGLLIAKKNVACYIF